jgi:putative copper export protein
VIPDGSAVLYAAARWLGYLAAFLLMGLAVLRQAVLPRARLPAAALAVAGRAVARIGLAAGGALVVAHLARLYGQSRSLLDASDPLTGEFLGLVLGSGWGRGWMMQLGAALLATAGWAVAKRTRWERTGAVIAAAGAALIAMMAPLTGHAVGLPAAGRIGPALDAVHFAAGGIWLGTLAAVVLVGLRAGAPLGGAKARDLVAAFSPIALGSGAVVLAAGLVMGYRYLGGISPLWTTGYGRVLLFKLMALSVVAGLGAYNWRVVLPRLKRDGNPDKVRQTAGLELLVGAILLAITALLVAMPAPGE